MPGLVTSPARSHASGSRQTTSPHSWCLPTGVPAVGVPPPARKGKSPHAWVVVAWYSGAAATWAARPANGTFQPQAGGTIAASCPGTDSAGSALGTARSRALSARCEDFPERDAVMECASEGQWGKRRASSAGQIPQGKVAANPAAWA